MSGVTATARLLPVMGAMVHVSTRVGTAPELAENIARVRAGMAELDGLVDATAHGLAAPTPADIAAIGARTAQPAVRDHGGVLTEQARVAAGQVGLRRPVGNLPPADPLPTDWPIADLVGARANLARLAANLELVQARGGPEAVPLVGGQQAIEGAGHALRTALADDGITQLRALRAKADAWFDAPDVAPDVLGRELRERTSSIREGFRMGGLPPAPSQLDADGRSLAPPAIVRLRPTTGGSSTVRYEPASREQVRAGIDGLVAQLEAARTTPDLLQERAMERPEFAREVAAAQGELDALPAIRTGLPKQAALLQLRREVIAVGTVSRAIRQLQVQVRMSGVWRVHDVSPELERLMLSSADRVQQARAAAPATKKMPEVGQWLDSLVDHLTRPTIAGAPFETPPQYAEAFITNRIDLAKFWLDERVALQPAAHPKSVAAVAPEQAAASIASGLTHADAAVANLAHVDGPAQGAARLEAVRDELLAAEHDLRAARPALRASVDPSTLLSFDEAIAAHAGAADDANGAFLRWNELRLPQRGALARARVSADMASEELRFQLAQGSGTSI